MDYSINNINSNPIINKEIRSLQKSDKTNQVQNSEITNRSSDVPFYGIFSDILSFSPLKTKQEKIMYKDLSSTLSRVDKKNLDILLKSGRLLQNNSNDGSSTLENLHKILKTQRIQGLDSKKILSDTLQVLVNPFSITQKFGDLPPNIANDIMQNQAVYDGLGISADNPKTLKPNAPEIIDDLNVEHSGCCVAASIEFNLADKKPAEFARYVEGLTSPKHRVKIDMKYSDIASNFIDAVNILDQFNVKVNPKNWQDLEVILEPDRDAIVRSRVQSTFKDPEERNLVDVLMQSTFMQLGSEKTYNSLTDKRYGMFNSNDKGLTEFEKNFAETIVDNDGGKTSITYQNVNEEAKLVGYNTNFETVLSHLTKTLENDSNVIIGITEVDETNKIIGGHEITVVDTRKDRNGELYFICNDTDDDYVGSVEIKAKDLIPKIHHAGIPNKILNISPEPDIGMELLKEYQESKALT